MITPVDPSGEFPTLLSSGAIKMSNCGLEFDPVRNDFKLWCGDGRVWTVTPPSTPVTTGWTIVKAALPASAVPTESLGTGIIGKWKYVPNLDVFMGLADSVQGNIWVYKPKGWVNPAPGGNLPPSVSIATPTTGASFPGGSGIAVSATATDVGGSVVKVEFFADDSKIGESTAAPYGVLWSGATVGAHTLKAVATDDQGASTTSAVVSITVAPASGGAGTITLQRGAGPSVVSDTYLSTYHKTLSFGANTILLDKLSDYPSLMRFAIFQSEGGPIPNGTNIKSATLSLYKYSSYDMVFAVHRLRLDWSESSATWNLRQSGLPWTTAGANGLGTDIALTPDAMAATDFNPGWINFDVTSSVQEMSLAPTLANYGWRLKGVSGSTTALKKFYASEFAGTPSLRPKLVITY